MSGKVTWLAWVQLVEEDEAWVRAQPRTLEREHVLAILADIRTDRTYYYRQPVCGSRVAVPTPSEPPAGSARGVPGAGAASERRAGPAKACCKQGAKLAEDWVERYKCPVHGWQDNPREAAGGAESEAEVDGAPPTASPIVAVGVPEGKPAGCACRVPGPGNGDSKCHAPMRWVCRCDCHARTPSGEGR